ncbi:MAG: SDR family NAD(P)-dependent oxidoreductase [Xenococcaceae cyanobacterium]
MSIFAEINNPHTLIVGASGGIGLGFVEKLLQKENTSKIYATYRRKETGSRIIDLQKQYSDRLICIPMDITDETQIIEAIAQIKKSTDKLHLVINCVGILHEETLQPEKSLRQLNAENLTHYFQVNSIGAILLAKHLLPLFRHSDRSVFATISAKLGSIGDNQLGGWYGYRASKTALNMFMRTAAIEYARSCPNNIIVTLHPGTTDTQLSQPFQKNVPSSKLFTVDRTVSQLLEVIGKLETGDRGQFFSWDGSRLSW